MLKDKISFYLDDSKTFAGKIVDLILVGVNIFACGLFVVDSYFPESLEILTVIEKVIVSIFIIEYLLRLWIAESKIKYIFSFYAIIDVISILPSIISLHNLRFLRGFKVLRILRFFRLLESEDFFFGHISRIKLQTIKTIFSIVTILFIAAGFIHYAEASSKLSQIKSFGDALYFSVITLSTVGYGDLIPITDLGRFVTVVMISFGAIIIPVQAGILINMLIKNSLNNKEVICKKCGLSKHDLDASHCKACGTVIFQEYDG